MKLPPKKRPGNPILASDWNQLLDAITARTPQRSSTLELVATSGGFFYRAGRSAPATIPAAPCPFGEIITWTDGEGEGATTKTGIRGGVVYAGDKVWNVEEQELNLDAPGSYLVWLEVSVTANSADDVLLPGLETSTQPVWNKAESDGGNYPDQEIPEAPEATGKAIVAVGILTIADGMAKLARAGCGSVSITHCPGSLSHQRM